MKPDSSWKCSTDFALELSSLSDWAMWNFGLIQTLLNWASKSDFELKTQAALVGYELLWILADVDWCYSSLKWHTKAVTVRLHLPRRSHLMTGCSCAGSCSSISKAMLFPLHHVFHRLSQNDLLLLVLTFFAPFCRSAIVSSVAGANLSWFNAAIFFSLEASAENFLLSFSQL